MTGRHITTPDLEAAPQEPDPMYPAYVLILVLGLRRGEVLGLGVAPRHRPQPLRATTTPSQPPRYVSLLSMIRLIQNLTAACRPHLSRTMRIACVVGTVLFAINQLNVVLAGHATSGTWLKVALTYLTPFVVANYGVLMGSRGNDPLPRSESDNVSNPSARIG